MNKLLSLLIISIILSCSSLVYATELRPSLSTQMKKQEQINKKNDLSTRLRLQAEKKQAAKDKRLAMQYKQLVKKNLTTTPRVIVGSQTNQNNPLVIKHPPEITPINTNTNPTPVLNTSIPTPQNVDISRVRSTWVNWYNNIRQSEGLGSYNYDTRLDSTAYDWNVEFARGLGQNHHRRNPSDSYYSFATIDQWFIDRGINPRVINRSKHTENVGYGYYNCNSGDCTDSMIRSIRSTFDFFMSEKGKSYDAHYRSIVNPYFTKIGLSIIVVPGENRYYLTVHYITE